MKFWDTIAKMCVGAVTVRDARMEYGVGGCVTKHTAGVEVNVLGARLSIDYDNAPNEALLAVNGHGFRIHDWSKDGQSASGVMARIGLIAIERIRPMKGKSGSLDIDALADLHKRATQYAEAVKASAPKEPTILS